MNWDPLKNIDPDRLPYRSASDRMIKEHLRRVNFCALGHYIKECAERNKEFLESEKFWQWRKEQDKKLVQEWTEKAEKILADPDRHQPKEVKWAKWFLNL